MLHSEACLLVGVPDSRIVVSGFVPSVFHGFSSIPVTGMTGKNNEFSDRIGWQPNISFAFLKFVLFLCLNGQEPPYCKRYEDNRLPDCTRF
jgi:hypothetical protein